MTRRHWGAVILVVWVASLAWLVKRVYFRPTGARLAEAALAVSPGAFYYHIGAHGRQVGFASTTVDTLIDSIRVEDLLVLDEVALGRIRRSTARSTAVLTRALRLRSVATDIDADGRSFAARGTVSDDTLFRLTLRAEHDSETVRWALARPVVVPSLLALRLAFGGELRSGNTYSARLFDPTLLAERDVSAHHPLEQEPRVCAALVRYVACSQLPLVIDDALSHPDYGGDEYVQRLGRADAVEDVEAGLVPPAAKDVGWQCLAGGNAEADGGQIGLRLIDRLKLRGIERRHAEVQCRLEAGDDVEGHLRRRPLRIEHGGGADPQRERHGVAESVGEEQLRRRVAHVALAHAERFDAIELAGDRHVALEVHRALRPPGRAR